MLGEQVIAPVGSEVKGHVAYARDSGTFSGQSELILELIELRVAVEAGVHYASICDDWLAADQAISQFSDEARKKGVMAIIGLGTSPGISNVAIRYFAQRMDKIRRADICVFMPLNAGGGPAVIGHTMFIMSGKVPAWRGGKRLSARIRRFAFNSRFGNRGSEKGKISGKTADSTAANKNHPIPERG
jgi:hypothetical protein